MAAKSVYRDDDLTPKPGRLNGSRAARMRMIARMTDKPVEDVQRMDAMEREARHAADARAQQKYPPQEGDAMRDYLKRFDSDRKPGESLSAAARRRHLQRIREHSSK